MRRFVAAASLAIGALLFWPWSRDALAEQPKGYANAGDCAPCHRGIAESYARTGMGRSWYSWAEAPRVEDLNRNNRVAHKASERYYDVRELAGRAFLRRQQFDLQGRPENVIEKELHFVLGSGNHARSYVHRTPRGKLLAMPVSWYAERGGYWGMAPGYERADHVDFRREVTGECLFCHSAYPDATGIPKAIDCQRCHGPGLEHAIAARAGKPVAVIREAIVNPSKLSRDRQLEVCYQCHLLTTADPLPSTIRRGEDAGFSYRPGQPLGDYIVHFDHAAGSGREEKFEVVGAAYRLRQSACFKKSALTCTTCHDAHATPAAQDKATHYNAVCLGCHSVSIPGMGGGADHHGKSDCIQCHMPRRRPEDAVETTLTDHKIRRRPELASPVPARPPYLGDVIPYYPTKLPPGVDRDLLIGLAQVRDGANDRAGIARLAAVRARGSRLEAQAQLGLAAAYGRAGEWRKASGIYTGLAQRFPRNSTVLQRWGAAMLDSGDPANAIGPLERARAMAPADSVSMHLLGEAYRRAGRLADAVDVLQQCTESEPDQPECFVSLGVSEYLRGNRGSARSALARAVVLGPELAASHNSLAGALFPEDPGEAIRHYRRAIEINPQLAPAHLNLGLALIQMGRTREGVASLRKAASSTDRTIREAALGALKKIELKYGER